MTAPSCLSHQPMTIVQFPGGNCSSLRRASACSYKRSARPKPTSCCLTRSTNLWSPRKTVPFDSRVSHGPTQPAGSTSSAVSHRARPPNRSRTRWSRPSGYEPDKILACLCFSTTYVYVDRPISLLFFGRLFPICSRFVRSL